MASLATPLLLASSLLAVAAVAGFAGVLLAGRKRAEGPARMAAWVGVVGALAYVVGQVLSGALLDEAGVVTAWLQAGGLVLIALAVSPPRVTLPGPAVLVPIVGVQPALVAAVAGLVAGLRMMVGGRATWLAGVGLLALGAAPYAGRTDVTLGALVTIGGALALGGWLARASARSVLAKFVTAFVAAVLALVVVIATVLSTVARNDLVAEELIRLRSSAEQLVDEISGWPEEAIAAASAIAQLQSDLLFDRATGLPREPSEEFSRALSDVGFREQDFFIIVRADGGVANHFADPALSDAFLVALAGDPAVTAVRTGAEPETGGVTAAGGVVVGFGVAPIYGDGTAPPTPPIAALVTGRFADARWASEVAASLRLDVVAAVAGATTVASERLPLDPNEVVVGLSSRPQADLGGGDNALYAGAAALVDPGSLRPLGQVITVSTPAVIADVEVNQSRRLFLLALLGAALGGLVAAYTTRRLVAPIRSLTAAAARVGTGDLAATAPVRTADEVGVLGRTFNAMTSSLADQSEALTKAASIQSRLRARLEALTRSMSDGLVAVDPEGLVIASNPAAERLLGYAFVDIMGRPLEDLLVSRLRSPGRLWDLLGEPDSGLRGSVQLQLWSGNGRVVPTAVTAAPVTEADGAVLGRVLVLRDVSQEVELERAKTEFLANVSHELRTPLTPIKGYAGMLARRDLPPDKTRRFAGEILDATARLERLVALVIDFAALDSGRLAPRREPTDLRVLTAALLDDWRAREPGRQFVADVPARMPPVAGDAGLLRRVLVELLDNAVKFSPGGEPVTVAARVDGDRVRLSVRDRGVGVDGETAERMFADFFQGDATETRQFGGLGLGLALVRRILDSMDVTPSVESVPGGGTVVHLSLPVAPGPVYAQVPAPV